jgi:hypothetical protein
VAVALGVRPLLTTAPDSGPDLAFSDASLCGLTADLFPVVHDSLSAEGPHYSVTISPGAVTLAAADIPARERTAEERRLADSRNAQRGLTWDCGCVQRFPASVPEYREVAADGYVQWVPCNHAHVADDPETRPSRVTEWSARSRARMVHRIAEADWAPLWSQGTPVMLTLTYPREWESWAPSAATVKAHLRAFTERWFRWFGYRPVMLWKLEFQRRGAPHFHILAALPRHYASSPWRSLRTSRVLPDVRPAGSWSAPVPAPIVTLSDFRDWVADQWSEVVTGPAAVKRVCAEWRDMGMAPYAVASLVLSEQRAHRRVGTAVDLREGQRMRDPKRVAVYFLKHSTKSSGSKEYQHIVPVLWTAAERVDKSTGEIVQGGGPGRFWGFHGVPMVRATRYVSAADFVRIRRFLRRWGLHTGRNICRRQRVSGGWALVNDGATAGALIARALSLADPRDDQAEAFAWGVQFGAHPSRVRRDLGIAYAREDGFRYCGAGV